MTEYVWQHDLKGEPERLKIMSDILDPESRFQLESTGVRPGWHCLEIGAGNGSLSLWLAGRVSPGGKAIATDIRADLLPKKSDETFESRRFDVVLDEPPDAPFDLIAIRALLHHLPERRDVVSKVAHWLKPGGWVFIEEPDFYPTWTVEPPSQQKFWADFVAWAANHQIDYYVGRKIAPWLREEGMVNINAEGHATVYNGGSEFAKWWMYSVEEVADKLREEAGVSKEVIDEFFTLYQDPAYWTTTIAFTGVTAMRPLS